MRRLVRSEANCVFCNDFKVLEIGTKYKVTRQTHRVWEVGACPVKGEGETRYRYCAKLSYIVFRINNHIAMLLVS